MPVIRCLTCPPSTDPIVVCYVESFYSQMVAEKRIDDQKVNLCK